MMLSAHFSLEELTRSQIALRAGVDNEPTAAQIENLRGLCLELLEPARLILGCPIHVDSGFRSVTVNALVGSTAKHSAHLDGRAADIIPIGVPLRNAFDALRTSLQGFDQIIIECNAWIHLAIPFEQCAPRLEALAASGGPGHWVYVNA